MAEEDPIQYSRCPEVEEEDRFIQQYPNYKEYYYLQDEMLDENHVVTRFVELDRLDEHGHYGGHVIEIEDIEVERFSSSNFDKFSETLSINSEEKQGDDDDDDDDDDNENENEEKQSIGDNEDKKSTKGSDSSDEDSDNECVDKDSQPKQSQVEEAKKAKTKRDIKKSYTRQGLGVWNTNTIIAGGRWSNDQLQGFGVCSYNTGLDLHYAGQWKQGKRHGFGRMTTTEGTIYNGLWDNNVYHGLGRLDYPDGEIDEGWFIHGSFAQPVLSTRDSINRTFIVNYRSPDQLELGLTILMAYLEDTWDFLLRRAMNKWRRYLMDEVLSRNIECREEAYSTRQKAVSLQEEAIDSYIEMKKTKYLSTDEAAFRVALKEKIAQDNIQRDAEAKKLAEAEEELRISWLCSHNQDLTLKYLKDELQQVTEKVEEHQQYREESKAIDEELRKMRNKIYSSLNDLHERKLAQLLDETTTSHEYRRNRRNDIEHKNKEDPGKLCQYVCGVGHCQCGLPKDIFIELMRIYKQTP